MYSSVCVWELFFLHALHLHICFFLCTPLKYVYFVVQCRCNEDVCAYLIVKYGRRFFRFSFICFCASATYYKRFDFTIVTPPRWYRETTACCVLRNVYEYEYMFGKKWRSNSARHFLWRLSFFHASSSYRSLTDRIKTECEKNANELRLQVDEKKSWKCTAVAHCSSVRQRVCVGLWNANAFSVCVLCTSCIKRELGRQSSIFKCSAACRRWRHLIRRFYHRRLHDAIVPRAHTPLHSVHDLWIIRDVNVNASVHLFLTCPCRKCCCFFRVCRGRAECIASNSVHQAFATILNSNENYKRMNFNSYASLSRHFSRTTFCCVRDFLRRFFGFFSILLYFFLIAAHQCRWNLIIFL